MAYPPRVYTIVLNYRQAEDTLRCIQSLRRARYKDQFLIAIDNASGEQDIQMLDTWLPVTRLIRSEENLGYAGGNNLGIRHALANRADYVWILNPDTVVEPETLSPLIETMERFTEIGILGSLILSGWDDGATVWYNGATIDWSKGGKTSHIDMGKSSSQIRDMRIRSVDYVTGASMLVRRQVFDDIGLLPEQYFLYFEETDFNVRARRSGWRVMIDPRSRLLHYRRSWTDVPGPNYVYYFVRNRLTFGRAFAEVPDAVIEDDLQTPIAAWRRKFTQRHPEWLPSYEQAISWALEDGRAGRSGVRRDLQPAWQGDGR